MNLARIHAALALLALVGCSASRSGGEALAPAVAQAEDAAPRAVPTEAKPAAGPFPTVPGIDFEPGEAAPAPTTIARDAAVVGRLTEQGQCATLAFEASAGDLTLFELTCYGYARGWSASSRLSVRDARGKLLAEQARSGQAVFGDLMAFTAPADGRYTLELCASENAFRYIVVRHSSYAALAPGSAFLVEANGDEVAHGFTQGLGTSQRFLVRAAPGSVVALRAEPAVERGWKHQRAERSRFPAVVAGLADPARALAAGNDPRRAEDDTYPSLALALEGEAVRISPGPVAALTELVTAGDASAARALDSRFAALVRVPPSGQIVVGVEQTARGPGTLFSLHIERDVALVRAAVRVGDEDDDPLAGVQVVLLREPALELAARGVTDAEGTVAFDVPQGPYSIAFRAPGGGPEIVRTGVDGSAVINLIGE